MIAEIETYTRSWRADLEALVRSTEKRLLVCVPFIKRPEAEWLCSSLPAGTDVRVLTDVHLQHAVDGSLDIDALSLFEEVTRESTVVSLPGLHAKVFVADTRRAIVTSANLTGSGLDRNYEYGVGVDARSWARLIRSDLEQYALSGSPLDAATLSDLDAIARGVAAEQRRSERSASAGTRRRFNTRLRAARRHFAEAHVGDRSANAMFGRAIRFVLAAGPLATRDLAPRVQQRLPDALCDDSVELVINGERYGKEWKHRLRNAQQHLKRRGEIVHDANTRTWRLAP